VYSVEELVTLLVDPTQCGITEERMMYLKGNQIVASSFGRVNLPLEHA
jgi:hypothetical protein